MGGDPPRLRLLRSYRHLYRGVLHAVQYSKPSRYIARDTLRAAFRDEREVLATTTTINRTLRFLEAAARETGLEHKVLKNMIHVKYWRAKNAKKEWKQLKNQLNSSGNRTPPIKDHIEKTAFLHYDMTIAMLNKTIGLCLR